MELECRRYISGKLVLPGQRYDCNGDVIQSVEAVQARHERAKERNKGGRKEQSCRFGTDRLEPGESMFIPCQDYNARKSALGRLYNRFKRLGEKKGQIFKMKSNTEGICVWREA